MSSRPAVAGLAWSWGRWVDGLGAEELDRSEGRRVGSPCFHSHSIEPGFEARCMMGSVQSRRCNLRVVLDGAEELRRELEAMRSRRDWAMDSGRFVSIWFKGSTVSFPSCFPGVRCVTLRPLRDLAQTGGFPSLLIERLVDFTVTPEVVQK